MDGNGFLERIRPTTRDVVAGTVGGGMALLAYTRVPKIIDGVIEKYETKQVDRTLHALRKLGYLQDKQANPSEYNGQPVQQEAIGALYGEVRELKEINKRIAEALEKLGPS